MAKIKPFKAVRANKNNVSNVVTKSYDTYTEKEIQEIIKHNRNSFLQIIHPFFKKNTFNSIDEKFEAVKKKYDFFKAKEILKKEEKPLFYLYEKQTGIGNFIGIIAAASTKDYKNNIIKKHEKTLKKRETLFKNYLKKTGFNAEPVLLTYPDEPIINEIIEKNRKKKPEYLFTTKNEKKHSLWLINNEIDIAKIQSTFKKIKSLYIADGHHRIASSYLLAKELKTKKSKYFLSYLISETNLKIASFNRLISTLNGLTEDAFLDALSKKFTVSLSEKPFIEPKNSHEFSMYLGNKTYLIKLKKENYNFKTSLHHLDTHILHKNIIRNILGIKNVRKDKRITYIAQHNGQEILKNKVLNGDFKIAFGLFPATVKQMKNISDEGLTMPPKSTYILPKLKSGLIIYEF